MEVWEKMVVFHINRLWGRLTACLGMQRSGLVNLKQEVKTCQYEDVHVMWQMLQRSEPETGRIQSAKRRRKPLWNRLLRSARGPYIRCAYS